MKAPLGSGRTGGFCLALLFVGSQALAQDYETPFKKGMRARDLGDWKEAVSYFQAAIAARPGESADRVQLYGMRSAPYLPHFYL